MWLLEYPELKCSEDETNCMDEDSGGSLCREMVVLYFRQGVVGSVNGENGQELIAMDKRKEIYNTKFINLL